MDHYRSEGVADGRVKPKQIIDRLNEEFTSVVNDALIPRKLVFWYDDKADFAEDIDFVELTNAKILKLGPGNQFATKYFLERQDTTTNYLIYAPFPKPDVRENHLQDTILYSKRFFADRASLLTVDLGIDQKYKQVIEKHIKFFANKERTGRFYDLEIENFNEENILIGLMSAVCRTRTCSFDEVIRVLLTDDKLEDNKFLAEFEKYDLLASFWKFCEQQFGYNDNKPTLEKLVVTLFITYADKYIQKELPKAWQTFISYASALCLNWDFSFSTYSLAVNLDFSASPIFPLSFPPLYFYTIHTAGVELALPFVVAAVVAVWLVVNEIIRILENMIDIICSLINQESI